MYKLATYTLIGSLPSSLYPVVDYISSPGVVIPAGLLLVLIIYYLLSLTTALREANSDLRVSFQGGSFQQLRMAKSRFWTFVEREANRFMNQGETEEKLKSSCLLYRIS